MKIGYYINAFTEFRKFRGTILATLLLDKQGIFKFYDDIEAIRVKYHEKLKDFDAWLLPTTLGVAHKHENSRILNLVSNYMHLLNVLDMPAGCVPATLVVPEDEVDPMPGSFKDGHAVANRRDLPG